VQTQVPTIGAALKERAAGGTVAVKWLDTTPKTQSGVSCVSVLYWAAVPLWYASRNDSKLAFLPGARERPSPTAFTQRFTEERLTEKARAASPSLPLSERILNVM
jgi:hypothetical protein